MGSMNNFCDYGEWIPRDERKTILLLSDDIRMTSGVANQSKNIVLSTCHKYNWIQLAGAINHPEKGKILDLNQDTERITGVKDPFVKLIPVDGYGDIMLLRQVFETEKVNALMFYTDPRFWGWLYASEHEIRQKMPMLYYHVWDDNPYPMYNLEYYNSCDWIGCISKQTYNLTKQIWKFGQMQDWQLKYIPHGINHNEYYPIDINAPRAVNGEQKDVDIYFNMKKEFENRIKNEIKFCVLYNSRNIRRKSSSDVILAFRFFVEQLPENDRKNAVLIMHTDPVDGNGTDLPEVYRSCAPDCNIIFMDGRHPVWDLNALYNIADVTINMSSAEGFGLSTAESLMAGTPITAVVTGGLQDQMRFENEDGSWLNFDEDFASNNDGKYKKHAKWAFPIFPASRSLIGSPVTPYIFDDRPRWEDFAVALKYIYDLPEEKRKECGLAGREWLISNESMMNINCFGKNFIDGIDDTFKNWKPRERYIIHKIHEPLKNTISAKSITLPNFTTNNGEKFIFTENFAK